MKYKLHLYIFALFSRILTVKGQITISKFQIFPTELENPIVLGQDSIGLRHHFTWQNQWKF